MGISLNSRTGGKSKALPRRLYTAYWIVSLQYIDSHSNKRVVKIILKIQSVSDVLLVLRADGGLRRQEQIVASCVGYQLNLAILLSSVSL